MNSKTKRIGVVPIGEVPEIASKTITAHILGYLNIATDILPPIAYPSYAYDKHRSQYNAGAIIKDFESRPFHDHDKVIGLCDVDIFIPIFTHVFGEARQDGKYALVSLYRLKRTSDGSTPPISLLLERAAKVALHELGHLFNLFHCMDDKCLMHFSGNLQNLDMAPFYFCKYCSLYLQDALQHPGK